MLRQRFSCRGRLYDRSWTRVLSRQWAARSWQIALVPVLVCALAGCGSGQVPNRFTSPIFEPKFSEAVTFATTVSYASALRIVTDLGLQPGIDCGTATAGYAVLWQPMSQRNTFAQKHQLLVFPASVPSDWLTRLMGTPGIVGVADGRPEYPEQTPVGMHAGAVVYPCPALIATATPHAGVPVPLDAAHAGTYARVTFAGSLDNYDAALYVVSNLGLALAKPCYDQALQRGTPVPWLPMGQETPFASDHALVVVTTKRFTSALWRQQLQATPGIATVEAPYAALC